MTAPTASVTDTVNSNRTMANRSMTATSGVVWPVVKRAVFRFAFVYIGLYVLTTQMLAALINLPFLPFGIPLQR